MFSGGGGEGKEEVWQAPTGMKIPGDGASKVKLLYVERGIDVSGTSQYKQKQVH